MRTWLIAILLLQASGCTVITVADAAVSAVIKTVETAVDWAIPD